MKVHRKVKPLPTTPIQRLLSPFSSFIATESAGGLVLIGAAAIALVLANSPFAVSFGHLWELELRLGVGARDVSRPLHFWINDGLMAVFFFLVGLEIKREALLGELASVRRAALPAAAALGGMLVPAAIYAAFNWQGVGAPGWGIPMATDIAFALGVLALLGSRVPVSLKVFLTALAIVDDIGAVLVIAVFYTAAINWSALALGVLLLIASLLANRLGVRRPLIYVTIGLGVWAAFLASGVHATVAGVLLAMCIPARTRIDQAQFLEHSAHALERFRGACPVSDSVLTNHVQQAAIHDIEEAAEAAQAPLHRIEHELQRVVAFAIIPLFALANAGVSIPDGAIAAVSHPVTLGVVLGLLIGKPVGITLFSWVAVRLGIAELPSGLRWSQLHAVSWLGGIGFTMSLFVTGLAFADLEIVDRAKIGIFLASIAAGGLGYFLVSRVAQRTEREGGDLGGAGLAGQTADSEGRVEADEMSRSVSQ